MSKVLVCTWVICLSFVVTTKINSDGSGSSPLVILTTLIEISVQFHRIGFTSSTANGVRTSIIVETYRLVYVIGRMAVVFWINNASIVNRKE